MLPMIAEATARGKREQSLIEGLADVAVSEGRIEENEKAAYITTLTEDLTAQLVNRTMLLPLENIPVNGLVFDAYFVIGAQGLLNAKRYENNVDYVGELSDSEVASLRVFLETIFDFDDLARKGIDVTKSREVIKALLDGIAVRITKLGIFELIEQYIEQNRAVAQAV